MSLFNKKLLKRRIDTFSFPKFPGEIEGIVNNWRHMLISGTLQSMNEKNLQGRFMHDFFVRILGYTEGADGKGEWTLKQHQMVDVDRQEADAVIGHFSLSKNDVRGVVELKSPGTSLDARQSGRIGNYTPVEQGHMYANKIDQCEWVIVSNFEEVRLYHINRSPQYYESFRISELVNQHKFHHFYYSLCEANLLAQGSNKPAARVLLDLSTEQQAKITKEFYSVFKNTRKQVLGHLMDNNQGIEPSVLLTKTQKLLDRIVFICFCESVGLLPVNLLKDTYRQAKSSFYPTGDARIWFHMQGLFEAIDKGRTSADPKINAYNGGLFATDSVLNELVIKDDVWETVVRIANYDFESDLGVNILGHIYEQSLSDIEELKAELAGEKLLKKNARRKRDGIYYTPEHVTEYIVRRALDLYLDENPERIKDIKILDMACGSGAFLNQAHTYLEKKWEQAYQEGIVKNEDAALGGMFDRNPVEMQRGKLLRHLYGVDLNEESVEITKLGLWLKTARSNEKLQNLDDNIKVGNAVIDDPEVAGEKAFDWRKEFPEVMGEGGFDVIVGNPPYVSLPYLQNEAEKAYYQNKYQTSHYRYDLYGIFIERSYDLLRENGILALICPETWMSNNSFKKLREWLLLNMQVLELVDMPANTFVDATVNTVIMVLQKTRPSENTVIELSNCIQSQYIRLPHKLSYLEILETGSRTLSFLPRINPKGKCVPLGRIAEFSMGVITGNNSRFITPQPVDGNSHMVLRGRDIERYYHTTPTDYIWYRPELMLENPNAGPRTPEIVLSRTKILIPDIGQRLQASLIEDVVIPLNTIQFIHELEPSFLHGYILAILNSDAANMWFRSRFPGFHHYIYQLEELPIPIANKSTQQLLAGRAQDITRNKTEGYNAIESSLSFLRDHLEFTNTNQRLQRFDLLDWQAFVAELRKQKVRVDRLGLKKQEALREWLVHKQETITPYFDRADELMNEIDEKVYELYGLTEHEIDLVRAYGKTK